MADRKAKTSERRGLTFVSGASLIHWPAPEGRDGLLIEAELHFTLKNPRLKVCLALARFRIMLDLLVIAATVAFFAVALAYVWGCNLL